MNQKALETLEYKKIIAQLKREMGSAASAKLADELTPLTSEKIIKEELRSTTEAVDLIVRKGPLPTGGLYDIREALKKIRKFPEKVIKYLWDDAFKFNPEALFDTDNMESLEQVIRTFVYSTGRDRFKIFKPTVRSTFYPDSQA